MPRAAVKDFELANPIYRGASVTFYTVAAGVKTATKATLYQGSSGATQLANPQRLDSHGKFKQPVYIDVPVIAAVDGIGIPTHDTGIITPAPTFRVNATTALLQYSFDGGVSWEDSLQYVFRDRGPWAGPGTVYKRLDLASDSGTYYFAVDDHTSGATFAGDQVAHWKQLFVQDAELLAIAALVSAADRGIYFTGSGAAALFTLTAYIRTLCAAADADAARTTLGVGGMTTKSVAGGVEVTLSDAEALPPIIKLTGLLTADINVVFPTHKRDWIVWNATTGDFEITVKTAAGSGVVVRQGTKDKVFGDGTDILSGRWAPKAAAPGGRLTLTSATPVTTADVSGATTVYYTPYDHDIVELYDGSEWVPHKFFELSQTTADNTKSPAAVGNNSNYDVFVWDDSGTLRATRGPAWSSDTARGSGAGTTEIERFEGRYVNKVAITNGPAARRGLYVGSIRSDGSAQINDTLTKRYVWNNYNRVLRAMRVIETADSWTYTTATIRQANANAANQLDMLRGLDEDQASAIVTGSAANTGAGVEMHALIGLDSTSAMASGCITIDTRSQVANVLIGRAAMWRGYPGIGRHTLTWLEYSGAAGTTTFYGDAGAADRVQAGIHGEMPA